jgi:crossover junction endodeoxyribonuclease RuvC
MNLLDIDPAMRFVGIDPATTTGVVALDIEGNVLLQTAIRGKGPKIPGGITTPQLVSLQNQLYQLLQPGDEILKEDAAPGTQKGITTGMIHGNLRTIIHRKGLGFNLIMPNAVKKYVAVTGWTGEPGSKRRLKDKEKKEAMAEAVKSHFGYTHPSNDVVDAYIIARISLNLYRMREYMPLLDTQPYQIEVIESILNKA